MSYTRHALDCLYSLTQPLGSSSSLLLRPLAVVGCGGPIENSSVYFYFRPLKDLLPSGAHYMVSRRLLEGFPPRDQLQQSCPSWLALSPSVQLSAKPLLGGTSQLGRSARKRVPGQGQRASGGSWNPCDCWRLCVCMSQGRAGHWLLPWLNVKSCHTTSLWESCVEGSGEMGGREGEVILGSVLEI